MLDYHDGRFRFYLETVYDDQGNTVAQVMERPAPYKQAVCVESFSSEWRACKRMDELQRAAEKRGESVVWNGNYHQVGGNPWMLERD